MDMRASRWNILGFLVSSLLAGQAAVAQERFSTITGTVVDESGPPFPASS
jgi:hypothetical protein